MMKKIVSLMMVLMMAVCLVPAVADETAGGFFLTGTVGEIAQEGGSFLMNTEQFGEVMVLISDTTLMYISEESLTQGAYVSVEYSGAMTFSIPGQVNALCVTSYILEGIVSSVDEENNTLLVDTDTFGQVIVALPEGIESIPAVGDYVLAYYNGIMAMSMPGRITAWLVECFSAITGVVTQVGETAFTVAQADESLVVVNYGEESRIVDEVEVGDDVLVLYNGVMTRSIPPQVFGIIVYSSAASKGIAAPN